MKWVIRIYSIVLLGYTGWRTYDMITYSLPKDDWMSSVLALLFLFATEIGLLIWHEASVNHTTTQTQHYIATGLTWVDFAGSLVAGIADMILRQTFVNGYEVPDLLAAAVIYGLPLIVALNVAGALVYLSNDADTQIARAKREMKFAITQEILKDMSNSKGQVARKMKTDLAQQLRDEVTGTVWGEYVAPSANKANPAKGIAIADLESILPVKSNGHKKTEEANPTNRQ